MGADWRWALKNQGRWALMGIDGRWARALIDVDGRFVLVGGRAWALTQWAAVMITKRWVVLGAGGDERTGRGGEGAMGVGRVLGSDWRWALKPHQGPCRSLIGVDGRWVLAGRVLMEGVDGRRANRISDADWALMSGRREWAMGENDAGRAMMGTMGAGDDGHGEGLGRALAAGDGRWALGAGRSSAPRGVGP
ncbi:hypothetical protein CYMTET_33011 [Cymbomonas tetramitiformis]|uniref:Uncharacterized protein n=1 Tax=Cymbomonas tetramitiformis TaxID=36881 RepID=A0AAE0FDV6_9CHLO|nr:hypothetical protein CYMTET_33011 [Cymbomonas tetramitiformis]